MNIPLYIFRYTSYAAKIHGEEKGTINSRDKKE